ncbi:MULTISPECIES: cysteine rich repeat-containing protein [unclassified Bradyrhizobium]|uniref:cysteine rich repeat-containing protein n=1 Tax=unclassified Bradyrhizobium TaxID=2631580 RepID=UPI002FF21545
MINTVTRARKLGPLLVAATFAIAAPVLAQAPSQAQRDAIKSQCRSDYMARCSSVPPGGEAALQCLQKNMSSLSSSCQSAVRAVEPPAAAPAKPAEAAKPADPAKPAETAAPKSAAPAAATAAPAKSAEPKAAAPAAGQPSSAQISAIRSACRSDYPKVCAGVPTGGASAVQCLEKNKGKLSAACEKAVAAATGGAAATAGAAPAAAAPAAAGPAPAAAAAPTAIVLRPMRPREELFVLRSACGADVRTICGDVPAGGGRIVQCLATNAAQLSPACKDVLSQFAAR